MKKLVQKLLPMNSWDRLSYIAFTVTTLFLIALTISKYFLERDMFNLPILGQYYLIVFMGGTCLLSGFSYVCRETSYNFVFIMSYGVSLAYALVLDLIQLIAGFSIENKVTISLTCLVFLYFIIIFLLYLKSTEGSKNATSS